MKEQFYHFNKTGSSINPNLKVMRGHVNKPMGTTNITSITVFHSIQFNLGLPIFFLAALKRQSRNQHF